MGRRRSGRTDPRASTEELAVGLGEAAQGGATVLALLLLVGAALLVPVLFLLVRTLTGQRRPALLAAGAWIALVAVLCGAQLLSPDARAQRHVQSLRDDVVDAADAQLGGDGTLSVGVRSSPCPAGSGEPARTDGRSAYGWEAYGYGDGVEPDVVDRFVVTLRRDGFATVTLPLAPPPDLVRIRPGTKVVGTRGAASVLVVVHDDAPHQFFVQVEDGCLDTAER